jgi:hypothetical protein
MKTAILVIATNKYIRFVQPLYESVKKYFIPDSDFICFTDQDVPVGVKKIHLDHKPFPYPTLMRYHIFSSRPELAEYDALFYCDADMLFVDSVGEITSDLTVVQHPGYWHKPNSEFPYERRNASTAFMEPNTGVGYYCGGFNGGRKYFDMCHKIKEMVDADAVKNITAVWHDESYLNRYLFDNKPSLILNPSYCIPDPQNKQRLEQWKLTQFKPILIALDKNHNEIRS